MGPKVPFSGAVKYIHDIHIRPNIQSICTVEDGAMIDEDVAYESRFVDGESSGSNQSGSGSGGGEPECCAESRKETREYQSIAPGDTAKNKASEITN